MKSALPVAILAGGLATRLHPMTEQVPKSLVDVNGEPFIAHQLRLLHANGIRRVVLCVGHLGTAITDVVQNGNTFGLLVDYSFDGPRLLGTAGAIRRALPILGDSFFVMYGDSYLRSPLGPIQCRFESSGRQALMTVFENAGRWDRSNVEFDGERILAYDKRVQTPRMRHIDYGLGVMSCVAFAHVPVDQPYDLALVYQDLLDRGQLVGMEVTERFYEIGSVDGLAETRQYLREQGRPQGK